VNLRGSSQCTFIELALAAMLLATTPAAVQAESNVAIGDLGEFGIPIDPNASGTKLSAFVTFAYDYEGFTERANACASLRWVRSIHVVATVQKGWAIQPFHSNYAIAGRDNLQDCWENQFKQLAFFKYVIEEVVIAGYYQCVSGGCPSYAVKSVKNFLTTGVGGASLEAELAVRP